MSTIFFESTHTRSDAPSLKAESNTARQQQRIQPQILAVEIGEVSVSSHHHHH